MFGFLVICLPQFHPCLPQRYLHQENVEHDDVYPHWEILCRFLSKCLLEGKPSNSEDHEKKDLLAHELSIGEFVDVRSRSFSMRYSPEQPIGIGSTEINPALQNLPDRHCAGVDLLWLTTREVESG